MASKFLHNIKNRFVKAYQTGYLPEVDGHAIYFQVIGNPNGEPVITFHGGPGSSSSTSYAYSYNLKKYKIIIFDQRGCGKTKSKNPLYKNTIQETIQDAKRLLNYLGIKEKVTSSGCSFGSTCALLFAETYPKLVKRILVSAIFLGRKEDSENLTPTVKYFYPDILDALQTVSHGKNIDEYFYKLMLSDKKTDNMKAMKYYKTLEEVSSEANLSYTFDNSRYSNEDIDEFRIFMHYQYHRTFLQDNQLLKNIKKIKDIPTEIYQNRWDPCCPPYQAYALHKALHKSRLHLIPARGHIGEKMFWQMYVDNLNDYIPTRYQF